MTDIPNAFGGFAPFPNTIMIPTMGLQSAVIGYRFGFGYEQGKRTLRAMSNEQFNTLDEEAEQAIFKRHDSAAINYFKTEMHNWVALQNLIIEKSVEIEVMKANRTPSALREIFTGFTTGFTNQQKQDAKSFFSQFTDPIMKLMAWFSGQPNIINPTKESILKINPITGESYSKEPIVTQPPPVEFPTGLKPYSNQLEKSVRYPIHFLQFDTASGALIPSPLGLKMNWDEVRNTINYYKVAVRNATSFLKVQSSIAVESLEIAAKKIWGVVPTPV